MPVLVLLSLLNSWTLKQMFHYVKTAGLKRTFYGMSWSVNAVGVRRVLLWRPVGKIEHLEKMIINTAFVDFPMEYLCELVEGPFLAVVVTHPTAQCTD